MMKGGKARKRLNTNPRSFKDEWFAGIPDIEEDREDSDAKCPCGRTIEPERSEQRLIPVSMKMKSFPPYLKIPSIDDILVKGSTCQTTMQLYENDMPITNIAWSLSRRSPAERYSRVEIESIIRTCASLGLCGESQFATDGWENEPIEGWWFKEDSYCEALRREQPIGRDVCGYDCDDGWWKKKQSGQGRDWNRWVRFLGGPKTVSSLACLSFVAPSVSLQANEGSQGFRSIGPEDRRREQYRLYLL